MKKSFIILLVCCLNLNGVAQTAESDKYYNEGVRLYNQKKYSDAIPYFEKSDSIDKETSDSINIRFDYSAIWLASCYCHIGDTASAKNVTLYYSVQPIDRRQTIQSDSLWAIGERYYDEEDYEKALYYYSLCAELEKKNLGKKNLGSAEFYWGQDLR